MELCPVDWMLCDGIVEMEFDMESKVKYNPMKVTQGTWHETFNIPKLLLANKVIYIQHCNLIV